MVLHVSPGTSLRSGDVFCRGYFSSTAKKKWGESIDSHVTRKLVIHYGNYDTKGRACGPRVVLTRTVVLLPKKVKGMYELGICQRRIYGHN